MNAEEYDETRVLNGYVTHNFASLMNDVERQAFDLAIKREKARHSEVAAARMPVWIAAVEPDAERMSQGGLDAVRACIRRRIQQGVWGGQIVINRCPRCSRIVKTPLAQQCLWCGHDWHDRTEN